MSEGKITCTGCGKQFAWKPELAGKKVKCKCGAVFVVPNELVRRELDLETQELRDAKSASLPPPVARAEDADETTPPNVCPNCYNSLAAEVVICLECGYNRQTKQKISITTTVDDDASDADTQPAASTSEIASPAPGAMRKIMGLFKRRSSTG